jgi:hypothetical protein
MGEERGKAGYVTTNNGVRLHYSDSLPREASHGPRDGAGYGNGRRAA